MTIPPSTDWPAFLTAALLVGIRLSGLFTFAPVFSSQAIPVKVKAILLVVFTAVLAPSVATLPGTKVSLTFPVVIGELFLAVVFGTFLSLINEVALFAGQLVGMQFSFSLVNLLDPNSQVQTPLFGQIFSLLSTTVLLSAGLHRTILAALLRSFAALPLGGVVSPAAAASGLLAASGGVFLAALQLAAPVMAATMLVEITVALGARISPHLPVLALTVPAKTAVGYLVLIGSLAVWPAFFESRFTRLLDGAQGVLLHAAGGHS